MHTQYYKIPISFTEIMNSNCASTISIQHSIVQNILLLITTVKGESKVNKAFGCSWWDNDFNLKHSIPDIKEQLEESVYHILQTHEKRLINIVVAVTVLQTVINHTGKIKIELGISGTIVSNSQLLQCNYSFLISPFSQY